MMTEVTLRNGVWIHETEWSALGALLTVVKKTIDGRGDLDDLIDTYWNYIHAQMDIEEANRVIRSLTQIVGELSSDEDDVRVSSVL